MNNNPTIVDYSQVDFTRMEDWTDVPGFLQQFPLFTKGQLEALTTPNSRAINGLDKVVKLVGRKLYIHVPGFSYWMSEVSRYTVDERNSLDRTKFISRMERRQLRKTGEKNDLIVSAFMLRNLAFLQGYVDSVEQKLVASEKRQTREYQAKRIEALARGREQRIKLLAAAQAQAIVIKADAQKQARIIRKKADAEALRLVKSALMNNHQMLTYRYIDELSSNDLRVMIIKNGKLSVMPR